MLKVKITTVGNSAGIILNKEVLQKLHADKGDFLFLVEEADGFKIISYDPEFEKQMKTSAKIRKKYRNAFKALSKS